MFSEPHWTENGQWAYTLIVLLRQFVRVITSRCQLQGLGGCRTKKCRGSAEAAWEQRDASWPWLPSGFKDTLTDSLSCVWAHTVTETNTLPHMFVPYFSAFVHVHACLHQGRHTNSHMCSYAWLNTQAYSLFKHTHTNPNKDLAPWRPTESLFQFFFLPFITLVLSQCQQTVICLAVWKWQSHFLELPLLHL